MTSFSKRRFGLIALLVLALAGMVYYFNSDFREPSYRGKTFSQWFKLCETTYSSEEPARQAIVAMGAPAVPFLVERLQREDNAWEKFYRQLWQKMPNRIRGFAWLRPGTPDINAICASALLSDVGEPMRGAGAEIIGVYERRYKQRYKVPLSMKIDWREQMTNPPTLMTAGRMSFGPLSSVAFNSMKCLTSYCTNDEIIPMILAAMHENRVTFNRGCPIWYTADNNTNLEASIERQIPFLLESAKNPDVEIQIMISRMLVSQMPAHPELKPLFLEMTKSPQPSLRLVGLEGLVRAPLDFETALPLFGRLCLDTNSAVSNTTRILLLPSLHAGLKFFPVLSNSLVSTNAAMRLGAAQTIRLFAPRARQASNLLERLANPATEPDENVRAAAAETLKSISEPAN